MSDLNFCNKSSIWHRATACNSSGRDGDVWTLEPGEARSPHGSRNAWENPDELWLPTSIPQVCSIYYPPAK